jgi:NADH-quinone oxidoreductase subunit A
LNNAAAQAHSLWSLVAYAAVVVLLVGGLMALSYLLGERRREPATDEQFESGIVGVGDARLRLSAKFYLIAMFFVIFDLETVFLFAWAIAFREVGWSGYVEALVFIFVLMVALIYIWRAGALDWGPKRDRGHPGREK